jgi:hypothetical protein
VAGAADQEEEKEGEGGEKWEDCGVERKRQLLRAPRFSIGPALMQYIRMPAAPSRDPPTKRSS